MTERLDFVVSDTLSGERVDRAVALLTGLTRQRVAELVAAGGVRVGGRPVTTRSRRVTAGETVEVDAVDTTVAAPPADAGVELQIVSVDDDVIVVDKPAGLVVHPGAGMAAGTMVNGLLARFPEIASVGPDRSRPGIVHRLDRGTSGLLVVARTPAAYDSLVAQLAARAVERRYTALVVGTVESDRGAVDAPIGRHPRDPTRMAVVADGREARTGYEVAGRFATPMAATLLDCRLETGRTHQIRVHLAAVGHPVVGDGRYGGGRSGIGLGRPFLHARLLAFEHPGTGSRVSFESALPDDLRDTLAAFDPA